MRFLDDENTLQVNENNNKKLKKLKKSSKSQKKMYNQNLYINLITNRYKQSFLGNIIQSILTQRL